MKEWFLINFITFHADGNFKVAKGQLISKCLFGVSNFPKNEQKQFDLRYHSSKVEFFYSFFLGELKIPKGHFEIIWPLHDIRSEKEADSFLFLVPVAQFEFRERVNKCKQ